MTRAGGDGKDLGARWALALILLIWFAWTAAMLLHGRPAITQFTFADPDDAMRLVQVRDWMHGQSWFDVSQHRSQSPTGAPMHWSRLVDVPIAGLIALFSLSLPMAEAEKVAIVAEPLLLFLALCGVTYRLTMELCARRTVGVLSVATLALSIGIILQFRPMRIDHHNWQIALGGVGVLMMIQALKGRPGRAPLAGLAVAFALAIAIEGLPLAVAIGAAFGIMHWRDGKGELLFGYLAALAGGAAVLSLATLGWPAVTVPWCDALSPAYLAPLATAAILLAVALRLIPQDNGWARLATLAIAGLGAALVFKFGAPQCAAGPFSNLDPVVYNFWYSNVPEGMPIWVQAPDIWIVLPTASILGLIGVLWAIRVDAARRDLWIAMLVVQLVTFGVSLMVMRSMGLAHLTSIPANAWMFVELFMATRRLSLPTARVAASVFTLLATPVGLEAVIVAMMPPLPETTDAVVAANRAACLSPSTLRGLAALPRTTLFAPMDISAHLLAFTHHDVIATGHHRARWGMKAVIQAFTGSPDRARRIIHATPSTYIAVCMGENEVANYTVPFPHSFMSALKKGHVPGWLQPVPMPRGESILVYRILPDGQPGAKRP